jgi:D-glycero-alpha-D-manno-heptose-7-phosphate kinase
MEFYGSERVIVNPLRVKSWIISELEASLVLFYTGVSRESAQIIAEQANNVGSGIDTAIEAMLQLKNDAVIMKEAILKGKLRTMAECMESTWRSKKKTAGSISNPRIEALCSGAHEAGALAAKVSGAGGGGFMMFLVDPLDRVRLLQYLGRQPGETLSCQFSKAGTQAWRIE